VNLRKPVLLDYVSAGVLTALFCLISYSAGSPEYRGLFVVSVLGTGPVLVLLWKRDRLSIRAILLTALVIRLVVFPLLPSLSDDVFRYIWDGILVSGGKNPYQFIPSDPSLHDLQVNPLFQHLNSSGFYSVYPPLSQYLFALGGIIYDGDWRKSYYVIKGAILLIEFGGLFILSGMLSRRSFLLLALNPIVVFASAGQGHTDALLVMFLGVGIARCAGGKEVSGTALVTAAGWIKLYPFFILPFLWRRFGWRSIAVSAAVILVFAAPFYAPYVIPNVSGSLDLYVRYFEFNAGPYLLVKKIFFVVTRDDWSKQLGPFFRQGFFFLMLALFIIDVRKKLRLQQAALLVVGLFLVTATTIHPWYFVGILTLIAVNGRASWHWQWLAIISAGTYLLYTGGPYWAFVTAAWTGWLLIFAITRRWDLLFYFQRHRSRRKAATLLGLTPPIVPRDSILDLGAGEGFVGEAIASATGARVSLMDITDFHRVNLPFTLYDGQSIPMETDEVEYTVLYFVLHHCEDAESVVSEALRISRKGVLIVESIFNSPFEKKMLLILDPLVNRLRSRGKMGDQQEHLLFRGREEWGRLFHSLGARIDHESERMSLLHRKAFFALSKNDSSGLE
jgi:SAM-dependent methyltransferase